jgi:hypothetical protein
MARESLTWVKVLDPESLFIKFRRLYLGLAVQIGNLLDRPGRKLLVVPQLLPKMTHELRRFDAG